MLSTPKATGMGALNAMLTGGPVIDLVKDVNVPWVTINPRNSPIEVAESTTIGLEALNDSTPGLFVMLEDPETFNRHLSEAVGRMTGT